MLYAENPEDSTEHLLGPVKEFGKVPGYKVDTQKSCTCGPALAFPGEASAQGLCPSRNRVVCCLKPEGSLCLYLWNLRAATGPSPHSRSLLPLCVSLLPYLLPPHHSAPASLPFLKSPQTQLGHVLENPGQGRVRVDPPLTARPAGRLSAEVSSTSRLRCLRAVGGGGCVVSGRCTRANPQLLKGRKRIPWGCFTQGTWTRCEEAGSPEKTSVRAS